MKNGRIKDVKIPVQIMLGDTILSVEEISTMGEGRIIALNKIAGEPVDVLAAGRRIAKGEVVVIDENFGVRVTEILADEG